jgi:hypothetical protein
MKCGKFHKWENGRCACGRIQCVAITKDNGTRCMNPAVQKESWAESAAKGIDFKRCMCHQERT